MWLSTFQETSWCNTQWHIHSYPSGHIVGVVNVSLTGVLESNWGREILWGGGRLVSLARRQTVAMAVLSFLSPAFVSQAR